ncbi:hypothetical protein ACHAWF_017503 [Thalassiosira exigua]
MRTPLLLTVFAAATRPQALAMAATWAWLAPAALLLPLPPIAAEKVVLRDVQSAQLQLRKETKHEKKMRTSVPFLSATLKTEIYPIAGGQLNQLSGALVDFLAKVFVEQEVYDVEVVGVAIFEERLVVAEDKGRGKKLTLKGGRKGGDEANRGGSGGRRGWRGLKLNHLQEGQFQYHGNYRQSAQEYDDDGDYFYDDDETFDEAEFDVGGTEGEVAGEEGEAAEEEEPRYVLTFATVVSAEHTRRQTFIHGDFQAMLIHICRKFDGHLVEYVRGSDDGYFGEVEEVTVEGYKASDEVANDVGSGGRGGHESESDGGARAGETTGTDGAGSNVAAASIAAMVVGGLVLLALPVAAVLCHRRAQGVLATGVVGRGLQVLYQKPEDDYSFDPLGTDNGYGGNVSFEYGDFDRGRVLGGRQSSSSASGRPRHWTGEEAISFGDEPVFRPAGDPRHRASYESAVDPAIPSPPTPLSRTPSSPSFEDDIPNPLRASKLPPSPQESSPVIQTVYAPPGKVGVAIDVLDGRPVVHKVKRGSPLEGKLHPGDAVVAIDGVETAGMSAPDVTRLMVRRMKHRREIAFVRG